MHKLLLKKIYASYDQTANRREDEPVFSFLNTIVDKKDPVRYLELGSGLCRFPLIIKETYGNFDIQCVEKSKDLVGIGVSKGLNVVEGDVARLEFADESFDVIHCAHVIEHLDYPAITTALDEMLRILKVGGYLIIRSPLLHSSFYVDIDHVRPYPPETVLNYFNNRQQQKMGSYHVAEVARWYRKGCLLFNNTISKILRILNIISKILWTITGWPRTKATGYVLIIKKI